MGVVGGGTAWDSLACCLQAGWCHSCGLSCFLEPASWGTHPEDQATVVFIPLQAP